MLIINPYSYISIKKEGVFVIKKIIIIAVNALCLIAFIVCLSVSAAIKTPLRSQQAARAWAGQSGERFAQLSAFFPDSYGFDEDSIRRFRFSLDNILQAASLESTPERTLYTDAWSTTADVYIHDSRGPFPAKAIAVGGDFFLFHPFSLRDGSYLFPDDVMKDRVLLDEELAWRLFGAARVSGFELIINGKPFVVAGVLSRETDFANSRAYTYGAGLFMSYDALFDMTEGNVSIETYEIVMPDPITGFALKSFTDAIGDSNVQIVENSARFTLGNSFALIGSFGERSLRTEAVTFPYWENAARYVEDWLALLLIFSLLFIAFPVVCTVIYGVKIIRFGIDRGKLEVKKAIDRKDKREYEKYLKEHGREPQIYDINDIIREVQEEDTTEQES